ncbi:hypothetical protein HK102_007859 [Quaeritorhiza haematococci]|nr:hypothetical protein HK102_007859 [Quaeritorhiza haematococci]
MCGGGGDRGDRGGRSANRPLLLRLRPFDRPTIISRRCTATNNFMSYQHQQVQRNTTVTTTAPAASSPLPPSSSTSGTLVTRIRRIGSWFYRFRGTFAELFLWMFCGSLALELRWLRAEKEEFLETVNAQNRKLLREITALREMIDHRVGGVRDENIATANASMATGVAAAPYKVSQPLSIQGEAQFPHTEAPGK